MASPKKQHARDLLRRDGVSAPVIEGNPVTPGGAYTLSTQAPIDDDLPAEAEMLGTQLREIARRYVGARRRSGEALLEATRWLSDARALADEGQWYTFLQVTYTSPDVAERLLNIHALANRDPRFGAAIIRGHFNQTVAGELARPSIPPAALDRLLATPTPPRVADVRRTLRELRQLTPAESIQADEVIHNVDNPHYAGMSASAGAVGDERGELPPWLEPLCAQLDGTAAALAHAYGELQALDHRTALRLMESVERLLRELDQVTRAMQPMP